jgi:hypothetical protein
MNILDEQRAKLFRRVVVLEGTSFWSTWLLLWTIVRGRRGRVFIRGLGLGRLRGLLGLVRDCWYCQRWYTNFGHVDDPYEAPTNADIVVDISQQTVPEIVHSTFRPLSRFTVSNLVPSRHYSSPGNKRLAIDHFYSLLFISHSCTENHIGVSLELVFIFNHYKRA